MFLNWLPWRFVIRRLALAHGFLDPIAVMSRLRLFGQPSEVSEPLELLRAGLIFHARGLLNTRAIQHNLDWVWPYWVERQFDPNDESFIPRAFSVTHVNLTHRNWTAVGLPGCTAMPIVDPRGLITPHWDGWSLDAWIVSDELFAPSRMLEAHQAYDFDNGLSVLTRTEKCGTSIESRALVALHHNNPVCEIEYRAKCPGSGWLVVALRPYNPEGVAFLHKIGVSADRKEFRIDPNEIVRFHDPFDHCVFGNHRDGDITSRLTSNSNATSIECPVGMATVGALFRLDGTRTVKVDVPLRNEEKLLPSTHQMGAWSGAIANLATFVHPDPHWVFLYRAAVRTLVLLSPYEVFPGPYTYKRFWFRDAAFILHALMAIGGLSRARKVIDLFPSKQLSNGYFLSQEGEWDSNGAALWTMRKYCELAGIEMPPEWRQSVIDGARWIIKKRLSDEGTPHAGLLPAGFSAEHLGPNDYYYWDDFWSVAGLEAAAALTKTPEFKKEADDLMGAIVRTLKTEAVPASPYRRMDAGAIGSIAAGYPLELWSARDPRLLATADFLSENCFVKGGFFQDMIHSGINAYLTLEIAQIYLRAGDMRYVEMVRRVGELASPTGQWPEAIHARTLGGCMGDGQHAWAAAEWILMMRNMLVREEGDRLILCSGITEEMLAPRETIFFGPTRTALGTISISVKPRADGVLVEWTSDNPSGQAEIAFPGLQKVSVSLGAGYATVPSAAAR